MANEVIVIYDNGKRQKVDINSITEGQLECKMVCSGLLPDGTICGIPMRASISNSKKADYFYEAYRNQQHKPDCPFCKRRKKIIISQLDRRALGKTSESIFQSIHNKPKAKKPTPGKPGGKGDTEETPENKVNPNDPDDLQKVIVTRKRIPRTLEEYCLILKALDVSDHYADSQVSDLILDSRTYEFYLRMGLPTHKPLVFLGKRTLPYEHNVQLNPHQWLLVDPFTSRYSKRKPFTVLLTLTDAAKKKMINLCRIDPSVRIYVYARFVEHEDIDRMYVSEDIIDEHMIHADFG